MGDSRGEYTGWGCLVSQFFLGGLFVWAALAGSSPYRYGKSAALLMGIAILAAAIIRTIGKLGALALVHPKTAAVVLLLAASVAITGGVIHQRRTAAIRTERQRLRLQRFQQLRLGMTKAEVEGVLGPPGAWGISSAGFDGKFRCSHSAGQIKQAGELVAWIREDGAMDRFVGYADSVVFTCFAVPCTAWAASDGRCIRWGP